MNLRQQCKEIVIRKINLPYWEHAGTLEGLLVVAMIAFRDQWPEDKDTRAIRKALQVIDETGFLSNYVPEVN